MDSLENAPQQRSNRVVWLILAICVLPVIASTALYLFWRPNSFVNHGELLEPALLHEVAFKRANGPPFSFSEISGQWAFVSLDSGSCGEFCERKLYLMRQIRLTQGKDSDRIERVWLITDGTPPPAGVLAKYEGTKAIMLANDADLTAFPAETRASDYIFVVDPLGNLMMRYPPDVDPSKIKKDISKLLRLSSGWRRLEN